MGREDNSVYTADKAVLLQGYSDQAEDVEVEQNDFELALASLTPSLSLEELARYQTLQKRYQTL